MSIFGFRPNRQSPLKVYNRTPSMQTARIAELLQPFLGPAGEDRLTEDLLLSISMYIDILVHWNARLNLTAIRDPEEIVTRHFGESFFAARHIFSSARRVPTASQNVGVADDQRPTTNARLADLGSGAGFPGIPIKLWTPDITLTLIEANQKKATFLREVVRTLKLENVDIQNVRAETIGSSRFDVITLRAVERLGEVLPIAGSLLANGGKLALLISEPQLRSIRLALSAFDWDAPIPIPLSKSGLFMLGSRQT